MARSNFKTPPQSASEVKTGVRPAKPTTDKPDYASLRRQVMSRYRKTLAYLAK